MTILSIVVCFQSYFFWKANKQNRKSHNQKNKNKIFQID